MVGSIAACVGDDPAVNAITPPGAEGGAGAEGGPTVDGAAPVDSSTAADSGGGDAGCPGMQLQCGSSCVTVATDVANCGRCAHDCVGGMCTGGVCQPVTLTSATSPLSNASRIATDGTSVCWTVRRTAGSVWCVAASAMGAAPTAVFAGKNPDAVAVLAGAVYWLGPDATVPSNLTLFKAVPSTASSSAVVNVWAPIPPANFYEGDELTGNVAGTEVYIGRQASLTDGTYNVELLSAKTDGTMSYSVLDTINGTNSIDARPHGIAYDGVAVYAAFGSLTLGRVWRHTLGGGGATTSLGLTEVAPFQMSVSGSYAYWADSNDPPKIRRSLVTATAPIDVVAGAGNIRGLVTTDSDVYFTQIGDSAIYTAPAAGGGIATKYVTGTAGVDEPGYLARDAKAIYWVDKSSGAAKKVALK